MGKLNSGQLQERITLLTTAAVAASAGGYGYEPVGPEIETPLWARVRPLRIGEKLQLGQLANAEAYEVTIRSLPTVSAKQRVLWKGKTLSVQGVTVDENREYLLLTCFDSGR